MCYPASDQTFSENTNEQFIFWVNSLVNYKIIDFKYKVYIVGGHRTEIDSQKEKKQVFRKVYMYIVHYTYKYVLKDVRITNGSHKQYAPLLVWIYPWVKNNNQIAICVLCTSMRVACTKRSKNELSDYNICIYSLTSIKNKQCYHKIINMLKSVMKNAAAHPAVRLRVSI